MKKNIYRSLLTLVFALCAAVASAQMKTSYFMEGSIQRYEMNPALTPMHSYVNMPLLPIGYLGINLNNNFASVDNFIYPYQGGHVTALHSSVGAKQFLSRMPRTSGLGTDVVYGLLGFGKYSKKHDYFWSFGWNLRIITDTGIPKEVFSILKDLRNGSYDIPDVTIDAVAYSEMALGFTMPVGWQNLVVGGRLKLLVGLLQAEASFNNLNMNVATDKVRATFGGEMHASISLLDYTNGMADENGNLDFNEVTNFSGRLQAGNIIRNIGLAVDAGAEAKFFDKRLKVSAGFNDLGFIRWSGNNSVHGAIDDAYFEYNGYNVGDDKWDTDKSLDLDNIRYTGGDGYNRRLACTLNFGAEYNFFNNLLGVGLLSSTRFGVKRTWSELTLAGTVRPAGWFTASISQSLIQNKIGVFGLALNFHPNGVNFFIGVDYIAAQIAQLDVVSPNFRYPLRAKSLNLYMGLAFTIKGRTKPW